MSIIKYIRALFTCAKPSVKPPKSTYSGATISPEPEQKLATGILYLPSPSMEHPIEAGNSGLSISISATSYTSGVLEPTAEELDECFGQVVCFISQDPERTIKRKTKSVEQPFARLLDLDPTFMQIFGQTNSRPSALVKPLRAKIRTLIKEKSDFDLYLEALIKAVYLCDMENEIELRGHYKGTDFNIVSRHMLTSKKVAKALIGLPLDYTTIGYARFPSFAKTDIKWITKRYGEPVSHTPPSYLVRSIKREAVIAYYHEQRNRNPLRYVCKDPALDSLEWSLKLDVEMCLAYHKAWYEKIKAQRALKDQSETYIVEALKVTTGQFVVADLETTGLDCAVHHITEIGALLCDALGNEIDRFEIIVNPGVSISKEVSKITGITNELVQTHGKSLNDAFERFALFVGPRPIFFHNAKFDSSFLRVASEKTGIVLDNPIFDTLTMARSTWKGLSSYSLAALSKEFGIDPPKHRAMMDVLTTHKVLLKIREQYSEL